MPQKGRGEGKFFDPEGRDMKLRSVQDAKLVRRGDIMVFHPRTQLMEVWRIDQKKQRTVISSAHLPVIDKKETFRLLAETTRDIAMLGGIVEAPTVPEPYWAFRFL